MIMTSKLLGSAFLISIFFVAACNARDRKDSGGACLVEVDGFIKSLNEGVYNSLPSTAPSDAFSAGSYVFNSLPIAAQRKLLSGAKRAKKSGSFYEAMESVVHHSVFSEYVQGCDGEIEYTSGSVFESVLYVAVEKWGGRLKNPVCTGYCAEISDYGVVNLTERVKIALYVYLFIKANPGTNTDDAFRALKLTRRPDEQKTGRRKTGTPTTKASPTAGRAVS